MGGVIAVTLSAIKSLNANLKRGRDDEVATRNQRRRLEGPGPAPLRGEREEQLLGGREQRLQGILEEATVRAREQSAVKSDQAPVPEELWKKYVVKDREDLILRFGDPLLERAIRALQGWLLGWWKRHTTKTFCNWLQSQHPRAGFGTVTKGMWVSKTNAGYKWTSQGQREYRQWYVRRRFAKVQQDLVPGTDAVSRAADSSWFGWDDGSRPFHWRWPLFYQSTIRDGLRVHFHSPKPEYTTAQQDTKDTAIKSLMTQKLEAVVARRYMLPGWIKSLTTFFAVPKGTEDIRMVYDASKSGLNDTMWVPRFPLPTVDTHLRAVEAGTYMCDLDLGEMFLNFVLHPELRELCGVDVTAYLPKRDQKVWYSWNRAAMGLKSSPYQAVQGVSIAEDVIRGDRSCPENPFRWDEVILNLPGSAGYDPTRPWVYKIRVVDGCVACEILIFVDDIRITGPTRWECWRAGQRAAKILTFLGLQDAARKTRDALRDPGPWAGAIINTKDDGVFCLISQEKWIKLKSLLSETHTLLQADPERIPRKRLEQIRGFLQYVVSTYQAMTPYLIGFHLTIDGWRSELYPFICKEAILNP